MEQSNAEKNIVLKNHMLSLAGKNSWQNTRDMTAESLRAIENAPWLANINTVILVGHGTSYATSLNMSAFFARIANVRATAVPAFQFANYAEDYVKEPAATLLVATSCSGNTFAVLECLKKAKALGVRTMIFSREGEIEGAKIADYRVLTEAAIEQRVTSAYSVSHLFLALAGYELAILMGRQNNSLDAAKEAYWRAQLEGTLDALACLPALFEQMEGVSKTFSSSAVKNFCVLGTGPNLGTMQEGALKISEFCWMFGAGEELEDFAHGRFREVDASIPLFIIAPSGPSIAKTMDILAGCYISQTPTIIFTDAPTAAMRKLATCIIELPGLEEEYLTPFLYVFPLWFYGWHIMNANGGLVGDKRHGLLATDINFKKHFDEAGNKK